MVLSGTGNTYSGTTRVNAGTLAVNGSLLSGGNVIVDGGTLSGSGTVGNVFVNGGGTLLARQHRRRRHAHRQFGVA